MMVPMTDITFPMMIFCLLPSLMPNVAMIIQPSHEANKKTDAINEIVIVFGCYKAVSRKFFQRQMDYELPWLIPKNL